MATDIAADIQVEAQPYIVLITSTIHFAQTPLCYTARRSVYSSRQRLEQTVNSVRTVRAKIPQSLIVLLENSELGGNERAELHNVVDWLVCFSDDERAATLRDGLFKGAAEVYMLLRIMTVIRHFRYEKLFKLSGRYWLSDRFSPERFPRDRFGVLLREQTHSTRLYCVPKTLEDLYRHQLEVALSRTQMGEGIEAALLRGVPQNKIAELPYLGVAGHIAVDGTLIDE